MTGTGDIIASRIKALGISGREAARRSGIPDSTLRNVLGNTQSARGDTLSKIASGLDIPYHSLLPTPPAPLPASDVRAAPEIVIPATGIELPRDVPVYGTVAGGELGKGAFQLTPEIVDYVRRPFGLLGAPDIYALYIEGESMVPKFEPGDLVFVHPHRKFRAGDYIIIQEPTSDNGSPRGFIKRFVAVAGNKIKTKQFNPPANIEFVNHPGVTIHKVMNDAELFGL